MGDFIAVAGFWVGVAGFVVAALSLAYAVHVTRRQRHEQSSRLLRTYTVTPLLTQVADNPGRLSIMFQGDEVASPHSATLTLQNIGGKAVRPEDCPPAKGSALRFLTVKFGDAQLIAINVTLDGEMVGGGGGAEPSIWNINAPLIPVGSTLQWSVVFDGKPSAEPYISRLADVRILTDADVDRKWSRSDR